MRSFIVSALIIASVLIGQQWVVKSSEAESKFAVTILHDTAANAGYAAWVANAR